MMNPDAMRRLDRWLGVPGCLLLTLLRKLRASRPAAALPRRVLFVELTEMGAIVLMEPALRRVSEVHGAKAHAVVFAQNAQGLRLVRRVAEDDVFCFRVGSLPLMAFELLRFMRWCRRKGIDAVVDMEPFTRVSALLAAVSGAAVRVGFVPGGGVGLYRGDLFTLGVPYDADAHMAANFLALAEAAFMPPEAAATLGAWARRQPLTVARQQVSMEEGRAVVARLQSRCPGFDPRRHRAILVHANVTDVLPQRRWPREHWLALMRAVLARHPDVHVFVMGSYAETEAAGALAAEIGDARCAGVAGLFALTELPALFDGASLLVTSDSGPAHFAAVAGLPVVSLFGPETPDLYRPLGPGVALTAGLACSPCLNPSNQRKSDCDSGACMHAIGVERVLEAVEAQLAPREAARA